MGESYSAKLNPYEEEYLEKNNLSYSDFVHDAFYKAMKQSYIKKIDLITNKLFIMSVGFFILVMSYFVLNIIISAMFLAAGLTMALYSVISLILGEYYARRKR